MSKPDSSAQFSVMDQAIETLIKYRRLVFSVVALLIFVGIFALNSMARQEDPSFPYRVGLLKVFYPGGTPTQIEKLITEPLEEEMAQVAEIETLTSTSRDDLLIVNIELQDYVYDTNAAWDRVQDALERARLQFPAGVNRIEFDDRQIDMPAAVLSITGSDDPILLEEAALKLKQHLLGLGGISRIEVEGAPAKEVIVKLDQDTINRLGISREFVAATINQRNSIVPGGVISSRDKNIRLNTQSDFASLEELRRTMLTLPSGQMVSLESIADVRLEPRLPLASQVFQDGKRAVSLGVIAQRGQVDIVAFGEELRNRVDTLRPVLAPLRVEESFFQPDYVQDRLDGLIGSLLITVAIIALIVFFAMGWRTGLLVSGVLPVVSMITLSLYSSGGGVFHQMAVIGMVISLGILIDNAIVVVEYIETAVRKGTDLGVAIRRSIKVLAKPLLASTGTTVAAFIPLLLAKGGVGDFTRAVPTMVVIAMIVSYFVSILLLPLVSFYWIKKRESENNLAFDFTDKLAVRSGELVTQKPKRVLLFVVALLAMSAAMMPFLKRDFFPSTDRAQMVIDIELPNNTPLALTAEVSDELESYLVQRPEVQAIYRYVGGAGFRFYYNMGGQPNESHRARFTVNTRDMDDNQVLVDWVRRELKPRFPDVTLVPRLLGQGPPRPAPIELRIKHNDLATLHTASQQVRALLQATPGITELRSNLDLGTPEVQLTIQDGAALSFGLQPQQVAAEIFAESRGLYAGEFRYDTDPVPIRVRSSEGQGSRVEVVRDQLIYRSGNVSDNNRQGTPLSQLAAMTPAWTPTSIRHHNYQRTVTVLSQIAPGYAFNQLLADFRERLAEADLPAGVDIEIGGDASASSKSNKNIATAAPLAIGLLIFFMMFQFNSFRRIGIVFASIPLAAVGVIPGLALSGQPFGFQSLLGVIALIGIVVNNAIVLIDVIDQELDAGHDINTAVKQALAQRTAPILLTTATTILGLLPLALSASTLWPPMAWAIISGLLLSTTLTLVAIPALCVLTLGKKQHTTAAIRLNPSLASCLLVMGILLLVPGLSDAKQAPLELTPSKVVELSTNNSLVVASQFSADAAEHAEDAQRRKAWAPKLALGGNVSRRDSATSITLPPPFGLVDVADKSAYVIEAKLSQPLFNRAEQTHQLQASELESSATQLLADATLHQQTGLALQQFYELLSLQELKTSLLSLQTSLTARLQRVEKQLAAGRVLKTDKLQIQVALNRVQQQLVENNSARTTVEQALRASLNLPVQQALSFIDESDFMSEAKSPISTDSACLLRKDCLAIEQQVKQNEAQLKAVRSSALPTVSLSLAQTKSDGQLFVADSDRRALLEFAWPLFTGGERKYQAKAVDARTQALTARLLANQQAIGVDVAQAEASLNNANSLLMLAQSSVELDTERLRLSRKRYDSGLLNIDELLDAESSLAQSQAELAVARIRQQSARIQQRLADGRAFSDHL